MAVKQMLNRESVQHFKQGINFLSNYM